MERIRIDDVDTKELNLLFGLIKMRMDSFYPVFLKERVYLATAFSKNAQFGGAPSGGWRPEKPGPWSAAQGLPAYLYRTGRLMESLASLRGQNSDIGRHEATFGTDVPYAKFHQYGTEDMPSRKLIFEPAGFSRKFAKDVKEHSVPKFKTGTFLGVFD